MELGGAGFWEGDEAGLEQVELGVETETAIREANVAIKVSREGLQCAQCGEPLDDSVVSCGLCGRHEHRRCSQPKCRRHYWYCAACHPHLPQDGDCSDPALN